MKSKSSLRWLAPLVISLVALSIAVPVVSATHAGQGKSSRLNWVAVLSGDEEVPSVESKARGVAIFQLSKDGLSIKYKLIVANIENVLMAHIHLAPSGINGPIVVWLYPGSPPPALIPGRFSGILATGTIDTGDLVGPLAGMDLSDLIDEMNAGNAYVNVHTTANPGGEVRGQVFTAGHP